MSLLKSNSVQIGQSVTATNNFTLSVPSSPDGTIKLARGNSGATTQDILTVNSSGAVTLTNGGAITLATAQASTSGTAIDFTSIPSWVKRVTVMFNGVSLSGSSAFLLQAGTSGGIVATGYSGGGMRYGSTSISAASFTTGVSPNNSTAGATYSGQAIWTLVSGNIWVCSLNFGASGGESGCISGGSIDLSATLDRVRITTVNGTDTFDAGSINIMYEG